MQVQSQYLAQTHTHMNMAPTKRLTERRKVRWQQPRQLNTQLKTELGEHFASWTWYVLTILYEAHLELIKHSHDLTNGDVMAIFEVKASIIRREYSDV